MVDEAETHICHGGTTVKAALLLHLLQDVLYGLLLVLREAQRFDNQWVVLYDFAGSKADGYLSLLCMILYEVHDGMQATVNGASVILGATEILSTRTLLVTGNVYGVCHHLIHTLVLHGADGDNGDAQQTFHLVDSDGSTVVFHLVHHVQCQYHGDIQLH